MKNKIFLPLIIFLSVLFFQKNIFADEGMWLPVLLKQLNEFDMQAKGLKLSSDDIYSVNHSSLKDAVCLFGGGCTGEIISSQGLLLTNYHCGYSQIQSHSSVQNDLLTNGYWSYKKEEELTCQGLSVTFIVSMEDVTNKIIGELNSSMSEDERDKKINEVSRKAETEALKGKSQYLKASVRSFYYGNEFYLFITQTFKDIRLVGAPPSGIGKFGGETDNWIYPRHTGDFSLFRIYADSANNPAEYSEKNIPYAPKKFLTISLKGVQENDFTMVYGFPGQTTEYLPSYAVEMIENIRDPNRVKIRDEKLKIWRDAMKNDTVRIKYAAKFATVANYWKKWNGEMQGLQKKNAVDRKKDFEEKFLQWINKDSERQNKYSGMLHEFELSYAQLTPLSRLTDYTNECGLGTEVLYFINTYMRPLVALASKDTIADARVAEDSLKSAAAKLLKGTKNFFRNYNAGADEKMLTAMMKLFSDSVAEKYQPEFLQSINKKYKGDFRAYAKDVFRKSIFTDSIRIEKLLIDFSKKKIKKIMNDVAWIAADGFNTIIKKNGDELSKLNMRINILQRRYMQAQREMDKEKKFYPDANSTLRVAYGNVKSYHPKDGITYNYYTTLDGIMEKSNPNDDEFRVPQKLVELYNEKNYGAYARNGTVPVTFIADNHTTGGNSGSPVLNGDGELIGTNFDRTWEGTMSDIMYDKDICRNIILDVRYTLFIIDKFAGAKNIISEMKIVK